jgi:hypothetical protein
MSYVFHCGHWFGMILVLRVSVPPYSWIGGSFAAKFKLLEEVEVAAPVIDLDPKTLIHKTRLSWVAVTLINKFQGNSAHKALHMWIIALCIPSALSALNAGVYYFTHGEVSRWAASRSSVWAAQTYAAPWISLTANVATTVLFVMFVRHRRIDMSSKMVTVTVLNAAWLFTLISFLVVE